MGREEANAVGEGSVVYVLFKEDSCGNISFPHIWDLFCLLIGLSVGKACEPVSAVYLRAERM